MKKMISLTIFLSVVTAIIGVSQKGTYTNITSTENFLDSFQVAVATDDLFPDLAEIWELELPNADYILRVRALGSIEYLFKQNTQNVEVLEVYKGSNIKLGEKITVATPSSRFYLEDMAINMRFVNFMVKDDEYLIFLKEEIEDLYGKNNKIYQIYDDYIMLPIFNYENKEHNFIIPQGETLYVPYNEVKNNEFFLSSEKQLKKFYDLKVKLFELYPQ